MMIVLLKLHSLDTKKTKRSIAFEISHVTNSLPFS
jgi:hypothetical protein